MTQFRAIPGSIVLLIATALSLAITSPSPAADPPLRVLLLGDDGHHRPAAMAKMLTPVLARDGINLTYTADVRDLSADKLAEYAVVAIFRDSGDLPSANEAALIEFVERGKGLVAIHCASHCFRNSAKYTALVGGRFLKHGSGVFRARIIDAQHPAMAGFKSFEEWDETYVHNELAADIRVLMARSEAGGLEPSAWVREQGKGRVFYTALGHDERAWRNPEWQKLIGRAIRWSSRKVNEPANGFEYVEANVPSYLPGAAWGTMGEPIRRMQKPLSPAESMKHIHLPEGFRVELFASEPDMIRGKPMAMAWDARGRLWLSETVDYPNERQQPGRGRDRIVILEDSDNDGRADKRTVFADLLSIPTSFAFANGGIVVTQAPDTLFLKDTDGDDKADVRTVLFTGWGTQDTHAGPSNLRPGLDNWLWGTVGYSGFEGTVGGKRHRFGQGIFRMKPDGSAIEFMASTTNNTWGLGFDSAGNVFASTANGMHSVQLGLPNRVYERVRGWFGPGAVNIADHKRIHPITANVRQVDYFGAFTAAAGHAVYTAAAFPEHDREAIAFVCEPTGHLVHTNRLVEKGTSFTSRDGYNLFASDDEWTAPIAAEVGPDGAVWIIDWYNFIVQHNPTPPGFRTGRGNAYETPLRDKTHGRIYRVVPESAKRQAGPMLDRAKSGELVAALRHDNLWHRQTAQRLLIERNDATAVPQLRDFVIDPAYGVAGLHALWILHALDKLDDVVLKSGLTHLYAPARRAAANVQPRNAASVERILSVKALEDDDAHVRMAALLALAEMPGSDRAAKAIAGVLTSARNVNDPWIPRAAIAAGAASGIAFLEAASTLDDSPALRDALKQVAIHVARGAPKDEAGRLLEIAARAKRQIVESLLAGLAAGWPDGATVTLDAATEKALLALPDRLDPGAIQSFIALARRWGQQDKLAKFTELARRGLLARLGDAGQPDAARASAAKDLVQQLDDAASAEAVVAQFTTQTSPALAAGLLDALSQSSAADVAQLLIVKWSGLTPAIQGRSVSVLLRRPAWSKSLVAALEDGTIGAADLSVEHIQLLSRHPDADLAARVAKVLARGGRLPDADRQKMLDELMPLVKKSGDRARGKVVFEQNCGKCHKLGELGSTVGPDLTGVAVRPRAEILTEILDPNRSVEGNYRQYQVLTRKGVMMTGLLAAETRTAVELLDSEGKRHVLLREDIDNLDATKISLMPEGFEKLPAGDLISLLDFLSARDKFSPLPLARAATIASSRGMFTNSANDLERLIFDKWGPQKFDGVPFQVIDPRDGTVPNVILLHGRQGTVSRTMPKSVVVPCNSAATRVHLLSGVGGWCHPFGRVGTVSMIVRLHYADGKNEDHPLKNGEHMADYIRVVDVPGSKLAFRLRGQQVRYLSIAPKRKESIANIEFVKGEDDTAPVVMAVTIEG